MKVKLEEVHYSYGDVPAIKDVTFGAEQGEVLGIVGPNASGKTTLLKLVSGIIQPDYGRIFHDEQLVRDSSRKTIARRIAYVSQIQTSTFGIRVFDAVLMGRKPHSGAHPSDRDLKKTSNLLELFHLEDVAMRNVDHLSGGERQKTMVARALNQNPDILLLDEPTNNLDLRHQLDIMEIVTRQAEQGLTVIFTLHDLQLAHRYSTRMILLSEGEIWASGETGVLTSSNIKDVYGVEAELTEVGGTLAIIPREPATDPIT